MNRFWVIGDSKKVFFEKIRFLFFYKPIPLFKEHVLVGTLSIGKSSTGISPTGGMATGKSPTGRMATCNWHTIIRNNTLFSFSFVSMFTP